MTDMSYILIFRYSTYVHCAFIKDLVPEGAMLVPRFIRLITPYGAIWSWDKRPLIMSDYHICRGERKPPKG